MQKLVGNSQMLLYIASLKCFHRKETRKKFRNISRRGLREWASLLFLKQGIWSPFCHRDE